MKLLNKQMQSLLDPKMITQDFWLKVKHFKETLMASLQIRPIFKDKLKLKMQRTENSNNSFMKENTDIVNLKTKLWYQEKNKKTSDSAITTLSKETVTLRLSSML